MYGVPILMVLIIVWRSIGSFLGNYYLARVSLGLVEELRIRLFESLLRLPNTYFDNNNSGHLISRITYNVTMVTGAATDAIKVVIREGLTVVFLFGYLLWMNWKLTAIMIAILPIIGSWSAAPAASSAKQSKKIQAAMGDLTHIASETIQGCYRVVRSFGGEDYEAKRFRIASADNTARQLRMVKTGATFTPALQLVTFSAMSVILFLVLYLRGDATAGDLIAYITAAGLLPKPIRQLSEVSGTIQKGLAGAESIFAQLDEAPETDAGDVERDRDGHIEIRNLSFRYPGTEQQVLGELNVSIAPGQMVAIVGRSGSGKSTLVSLLPRFYHHREGQILIDGVDVEKYTLRNLRRHIALVTQQVVLFNDTITANIAYGDLAGTPREAIEQAAEAAYAREFIDKLPQGFDTLVGENGVLLSGGQRQRLAIARALPQDAPILILDEATSALDTESERHIQAALDKVMEGRTTLVIAHRLTTIEKADLILVMDQGHRRARHACRAARRQRPLRAAACRAVQGRFGGRALRLSALRRAAERDRARPPIRNRRASCAAGARDHAARPCARPPRSDAACRRRGRSAISCLRATADSMPSCRRA